MAVHRFTDSLEISHRYADAPWWELVYRAAFPSFDSMQDLRKNGWWQKAGIDRLVHLGNGTSVKVDEKVRLKDWRDILLEVWSDREQKLPGWAMKDDLDIDYIAYAFVPSQTCYLLPFRLLRRALTLNQDEWFSNAKEQRGGFAVIRAVNDGYTTVSIVVPTQLLLRSIAEATVVRWGNGRALALRHVPPPPSSSHEQELPFA